MINSGDTAWVLTSTALVMLMTPGLALFYGGRVRRKNVLSTIMHSIFILALVSVTWVLIGFTLAFLRHFEATTCSTANPSAPRASAIAVPDTIDTSCSADGPPISTVTFSESGSRRSSHGLDECARDRLDVLVREPTREREG